MTAPSSSKAAAGDRRPFSRGTILAIVAVVVFLYMIHQILLPFVGVGTLAYICTPLVDGIARRFHMPRALAVVIVFLAFAAAVSLLGWWGVPALVTEFGRVFLNLPQILDSIAKQTIGNGAVHFMGQTMTADQISRAALNGLRELLEQEGRLLLLASWGFAGLFGFFLGWVLFFYFLIGAKRIGGGLFWLTPPERREFAAKAWTALDPILRRYFVGIAIIVTYACIAAYIGLGLMLGIRHALFLALLTGLLEMIPVVGPASSAAIAGLMAVAQAKGMGAIFAYVVYAIALRLSIDQLLTPIVLGAAARLSPTLIIFSFLSGATLFGISGILLAVPFCLALKVVLATMYNEPLTGQKEAGAAK